MWRTPNGDRVLRGVEAEAFYSAWCARIEFTLDGDDETGVAYFDQYERDEQILALYYIFCALFYESVPVQIHYGWSESAIYSVFAQMYADIEAEVHGTPRAKTTRRQVLNAVLNAVNPEDDEKVPKDTCRDTEEWDMWIEVLADCILWDRDWDLAYVKCADGKTLLDQHPDVVKSLDAQMGIGGADYFSWAPTPTKEQLKQIKHFVKGLPDKFDASALPTPPFIICHPMPVEV